MVCGCHKNEPCRHFSGAQAHQDILKRSQLAKVWRPQARQGDLLYGSAQPREATHPKVTDRTICVEESSLVTSTRSCLLLPCWGSSLWLLQPILGARQMEAAGPSPRLRRWACATPPSLQASGPPPFPSSLPAAAWLQGTSWAGGVSTEKGVLGCEVVGEEREEGAE